MIDENQHKKFIFVATNKQNLFSMIEADIRKQEKFFKPCRVYWWSGYYVPVRNNWSFKIEYRHLTENEREQYLAKFGTKLISALEFDTWISEAVLKNN